MNQELYQEVVQILRGPCGVQTEIEPNSKLVQELGLDSLGFLSLAVSLENRFRNRLEENSNEPPQTVAQVVALVETRLAEQVSQ